MDPSGGEAEGGEPLDLSRMLARLPLALLEGRPGVRHRSRPDPGAEDLGHAPGLSDAAPWSVRFLGAEDLAHRADASLVQMRHEALQEAARSGTVVGMDAEPGVDQRSDQPGPDG